MSDIMHYLKYLDAYQTKLRFIIIGGVNTLVGLSLFPILYVLDGKSHLHYMVIFVISYMGTTTFSFITNKIFVFRTRDRYFEEYVKFMSFQVAHFIVNSLGLPVLVEFFGLNPVYAQPIFAIFVIVTSYFWYSRIAFYRHGE